MKCILCRSAHTQEIEHISKDVLANLYQKSFSIDIENILQTNLIYWHCENCDLRFFSREEGSIPTGDNDFYNALNQLAWYYMSEKHEYHYARDFITSHSNVLEVGCGKAAFASFLPEGARYVGLEFSTQAKDMAQKAGIEIQNISIEEFSKTHIGEFDVSCSFQVLEHVGNPYKFLNAQIACLRNSQVTGGGHKKYLIIAVPSEESFLTDCVNGILNMPPHHVSRFSDKTLQTIAQIFSLRLVNIYHEQVQSEHKIFYKNVVWAKFFLKPTLIDTSLKRKVLNQIGRLGKYLIKIPNNVYGHTAVAVYEV
ncbi:class I SAM-dependent methyltransferase [Helicobacter himalayensis]|uniref:class I SAM-dependent methyltransferase n=1 Tax=Helicobacter himalayensis TaxID=1591088 RepID=UPI0009EF1B0D|nr:methyltransferase domain-containing protein [Helicobacter himalayensis]